MEHTLYWLWISLKRRVLPAERKRLYEQFGSIEAVFEAKDYSKVQELTAAAAEDLNDKSLDEAKRVYDEAREVGAQVIVFDSEEYPERLRQISDPPSVLYVRGRLKLVPDNLSVGVVGTRVCTQYGIEAVKYLCSELVKNGAVIVSGMARGIDTAAAQTVLENGGYTAAVLGCGVDVVYPPENGGLMNEIISCGAVVSEYPPGTPPSAKNFPFRNRIISGMSDGVLVAEAPKKSGALITARLAADEGRDVFCIPGSIFSDSSAGANRFIQQGAKLVTCAQDIFCEYPAFVPKYREKPRKREEAQTLPPVMPAAGLTAEERIIFDILNERDMYIDNLIRKSGMSAAALNTVIVMLEVKGVVKHKPGNIYGLVR